MTIEKGVDISSGTVLIMKRDGKQVTVPIGQVAILLSPYNVGDPVLYKEKDTTTWEKTGQFFQQSKKLRDGTISVTDFVQNGYQKFATNVLDILPLPKPPLKQTKRLVPLYDPRLKKNLIGHFSEF